MTFTGPENLSPSPLSPESGEPGTFNLGSCEGRTTTQDGSQEGLEAGPLGHERSWLLRFWGWGWPGLEGHSLWPTLQPHHRCFCPLGLGRETHQRMAVPRPWAFALSCRCPANAALTAPPAVQSGAAHWSSAPTLGIICSRLTLQMPTTCTPSPPSWTASQWKMCLWPSQMKPCPTEIVCQARHPCKPPKLTTDATASVAGAS